MGCCDEKLKIERLRLLSHACVLACQAANLTETKLAVVKLTHKTLGDYYEGIDYDRAKAEGRKIYRKFEPGDTMAVQKGNRDGRTKVSARAKKV